MAVTMHAARPVTLVDVDPRAAPAQVAAEVAEALGTLLCRKLGHTGPAPCAECSRSGEILAPSVGRALFFVARRGGHRPLTDADYRVVGIALDWFDELAGRRRRSPWDTATNWPRP